MHRNSYPLRQIPKALGWTSLLRWIGHARVHIWQSAAQLCNVLVPAHLEILFGIACPRLRTLEDGQVGVPGRESSRHRIGRINGCHLRQPRS